MWTRRGSIWRFMCPMQSMSNAVYQKHQDVLLHPVTFCSTPASLLFWAIPTHNPLRSGRYFTSTQLPRETDDRNVMTVIMKGHCSDRWKLFVDSFALGRVKALPCLCLNHGFFCICVSKTMIIGMEISDSRHCLPCKLATMHFIL